MQIECDSVEFELKLNVIQFCLFDGNLQLSNSFLLQNLEYYLEQIWVFFGETPPFFLLTHMSGFDHYY